MIKETTFIYGLYSTGNVNLIRYVGKTVNIPRVRLNDHISGSKSRDTYKDRWIKRELSLGYKIKIELIDEVHTSDWEFWETFYINQYRKVFRLTNTQPGGLSSGTEKRVVVLDLFGNKLHALTSIAQAARTCSVNVKRVESILSINHYAKSIKGFQFILESKYNPNKSYDINTYYYKYNSKFKFIGKYVRKTLKDRESITSAISHKIHHKGFIWAYNELSVEQLGEYRLKRSKPLASKTCKD